MHPEDLDLFELVEGELDGERAAQVRAHVAACARCAEEVRLLEAGKEALRTARLLELPEPRLRRLLVALPRQERERGVPHRRRRVFYVLAPVAAAVAVVLAVTSGDFGGGGGEERAAAPPPAEAAEAPADAAKAGAEPTEEASALAAPSAEPSPAATGGAAGEALEASAPLAMVAGPPEDVAAVLREAGLQAAVVDGSVEVTGADRAAVERALAGRETGDVAVFVR
jgi:hypothetical protein